MAGVYINGDWTSEELVGGDGDDIIEGNAGNDVLRGLYGDDYLFGESGDDILWGGADNDRLHGGSGFDELHGGSGDDVLYFSGEDIYEGGDGNDTFSADIPWLRYDADVNGLTVWVERLAPAEGLRIDLETGLAEERGSGAATEDFYAPGATPIGSGDAEFHSIGTYLLTDHGDYFAGDETGDEIEGYGGDDIIEGRGGADEIDGGAGSDTAEYGSSPIGVDVDLERGTGLRGDAAGDTYASIENIRGTAHVDALYGNDGTNTILGRAGDDILEGRGGGDVLDGGDGVDTVFYTSSPDGVNVDLTRTTVQSRGDAAGDILRSIENVEGSADADVLTGEYGTNRLLGWQGNDTIDGGFGDDVLVGGQGTDTVSFVGWGPTEQWYSPTVESIRIELGEGSAGGTATRTIVNTVVETDEIYAFENVRGSNRYETIIGNSGDNVIEARGGNDVVDGGFGDDTLSGGNDVDTVSFESWDPTGLYIESPLQSIRIELADSGWGAATWTYGGLLIESDDLSTFENVRGSNRSETIVGNSGDNRIEGRGGNDVLLGNGGDDVLDGGLGTDTASYESNTARVIAYLGPNGIPGQGYEYALVNGAEELVSVDTLFNIENLTGSAFDDALVGNEGLNTLRGGNGNDTLNGGANADTLIGGLGSDTYMVDNAGDTIVESGGEGTDTVISSVSYTLTAGADVENLRTSNDAGTAAINLSGNNTGNIVRGNNGNNTLNGAFGDDDLIGLGGQDSFLFNSAFSATNNIDRVLDFNVADDTILLDDALFGGLKLGALGATQFVIGAAAQDASDRIIYNSANGALLFDSDGVGGTAAIQFAELTPGLALSNLDFLVV
jgi:serralysin